MMFLADVFVDKIAIALTFTPAIFLENVSNFPPGAHAINTEQRLFSGATFVTRTTHLHSRNNPSVFARLAFSKIRTKT